MVSQTAYASAARSCLSPVKLYHRLNLPVSEFDFLQATAIRDNPCWPGLSLLLSTLFLFILFLNADRLPRLMR